MINLCHGLRNRHTCVWLTHCGNDSSGESGCQAKPCPGSSRWRPSTRLASPPWLVRSRSCTDEGRVYTVRGWGTFVSETPPG